MPWIKRNLLFVVGLVVAVALIGAGVWYLLGTMQQSTDALAELEAKNQKLDQLFANDPFPEKKNIDLAKTEQVKLMKFQAEAMARFQTNDVPKDLDSQRYQSVLLGTLAELERAAAQSGTKLPSQTSSTGGTTEYAFTFGPQKGNTQIPVGRLGELTAQLADIQAIAHVIFRAKVHALTSLKRAGASTNDYGNADILTGKKPVTDPVTGAVLRPYEVQFQSFSTELGDVLAGFANTPETIVVRAVNIQRGTLNLDSPSAAPAVLSPGPFGAAGAAGPGGMDRALLSRYGIRPGMSPGAPLAAAAPVPFANTSGAVVEEKPIQVSISLDVVKLGAPGVAVAKAPKRAAEPVAETP